MAGGKTCDVVIGDENLGRVFVEQAVLVDDAVEGEQNGLTDPARTPDVLAQTLGDNEVTFICHFRGRGAECA